MDKEFLMYEMGKLLFTYPFALTFQDRAELIGLVLRELTPSQAIQTIIQAGINIGTIQRCDPKTPYSVLCSEADAREI